MTEWIRTSKARLVFRYEISDLLQYKIFCRDFSTPGKDEVGNSSSQFGQLKLEQDQVAKFLMHLHTDFERSHVESSLLNGAMFLVGPAPTF